MLLTTYVLYIAYVTCTYVTICSIIIVIVVGGRGRADPSVSGHRSQGDFQPPSEPRQSEIFVSTASL
jgi:hypothetical protein